MFPPACSTLFTHLWILKAILTSPTMSNTYHIRNNENRILCYSYCAHSYIHCINQWMHSIKYKSQNTIHGKYQICTYLGTGMPSSGSLEEQGIQVPKNVGVWQLSWTVLSDSYFSIFYWMNSLVDELNESRIHSRKI